MSKFVHEILFFFVGTLGICVRRTILFFVRGNYIGRFLRMRDNNFWLWYNLNIFSALNFKLLKLTRQLIGSIICYALSINIWSIACRLTLVLNILFVWLQIWLIVRTQTRIFIVELRLLVCPCLVLLKILDIVIDWLYQVYVLLLCWYVIFDLHQIKDTLNTYVCWIFVAFNELKYPARRVL